MYVVRRLLLLLLLSCIFIFLLHAIHFMNWMDILKGKKRLLYAYPLNKIWALVARLFFFCCFYFFIYFYKFISVQQQQKRNIKAFNYLYVEFIFLCNFIFSFDLRCINNCDYITWACCDYFFCRQHILTATRVKATNDIELIFKWT